MKKIPLKYLSLFCIILGLLIITNINGARSAGLIKSDTYVSDFEMFDIGITLRENGNDVGHRNYLATKDAQDKYTVSAKWDAENSPLLTDITNFEYGKKYVENYDVLNSGTIDEYVRVKVYKYWIESSGSDKKVYDLDPAKIVLDFSYGDNGWILDERETTTERTILYFKNILETGKDTPEFLTGITVDGEIRNEYSVKKLQKGDDGYKDDGYTRYVYEYKYDGKVFCLEIEADAIQTHNAVDAAKSAWGRNINIDKATGTLSLAD